MAKSRESAGVSPKTGHTLILAGATSLVIVRLAGVVPGSADAALHGQESAGRALAVDCDPTLSVRCARLRHAEGRKLFDVETFGGNGRTCRTCHSKKTGTFSPKEARQRLLADPNDPLFLHDGLDNGQFGTSRITEHATVRIEIRLPDDVTLADDPERRTVVFNRGTPSTMNTPALDRFLMYDTREPNLQLQAFNAIHGHAQATNAPSSLELDLIKEFQQTDTRFFSSAALERFAQGGPPPRLPSGTTASERRGRAMFDDDVPFDGTTSRGICTVCHAGPMLNQFAVINPIGPPGGRRADIGVSQRNLIGNPLYSFIVKTQDGKETVVNTPDPGVMLITPLPGPPPGSGFPPQPRAFFANVFKIPTLWGVARTAPYFHDNSAKTLEEVAEHYAFYFRTGQLRFDFTAQDEADMVAFLRLLD